ncbi:hypothetical protein Dalk_4579 [Desulfatibacillum aliphaticivorans]|uniref:Uncharacterized protein n=1 Tax=Desulfatibacillum aliphaticivorans TaxID=218208 RepID=B8FNH6_DESAL|nr:DUF987 family protein [Desulfatibacillum aliphaticivorans]ACL06257.1 hypothetical protein Dalk_4579 [Desulfatibacillum aliphaticivorans]
MKIVTKKDAVELASKTILDGKNRAKTPTKYDSGKYKWTGKASDYTGVDIDFVWPELLAVYVERRSDANGPYAQLMCFCRGT